MAEHVGYEHLLSIEKILSSMQLKGPVDALSLQLVVKRHLKKVLSESLIIDMVQTITRDDDHNTVSSNKLSSLLDAYKFASSFPKVAFKNDSSNYKKKMMLEEDIKLLKQSDVQELLILLIEKLEEKFCKFQKAYYFFDFEQDGKIYFTQFKQTLDKLCIRCTDLEAKQLFVFLDTKKDGILDYEEFCQLVPNKLELDMLDRNGESLTLKTQLIYVRKCQEIIKQSLFEVMIDCKLYIIKDKFGDLESYCVDPYRMNERSRFKHEKFLDDIENKIGKDIFYSDKLRKIIDNNVVMRQGRAPPGVAARKGYDLPTDPSFVYGQRTQKGQNMNDVMKNNYAKEWLLDIEDKRKQRDEVMQIVREKRKFKDTLTNKMRQLHISRCISEESRSNNGLRKYAEANQIRPVFEKTYSDLKNKNMSYLEESKIGNGENRQNIGQLLRSIHRKEPEQVQQQQQFRDKRINSMPKSLSTIQNAFNQTCGFT